MWRENNCHTFCRGPQDSKVAAGDGIALMLIIKTLLERCFSLWSRLEPLAASHRCGSSPVFYVRMSSISLIVALSTGA